MAGRQSVRLEQEQIDELREVFDSLDDDGNGSIDMEELQTALQMCGVKIPTYQVRDITESFINADRNKDNKLDMEEFKALYVKLKKESDVGLVYKKNVSTRKDIQQTEGSSEGITHSVKDSERIAFSNWINTNLAQDEDCKEYLPIVAESDDLFIKVKDGILLCKLVNNSVENCIDERAINKKKGMSVYLRLENHNLLLNSAQSIGCNIVNIGHGDIEAGKPHLVLGLLWQIIRIGLLSQINLTSHPGLVLLLEEGESIDDLLKLSPEEILIRWVNYHLRNAGIARQITNFGSDIKDSEAYIYLLHQIAPHDKGLTLEALGEQDAEDKAEAMLTEAEKIDCRAFITAKDVVKGNQKLNLAFVANLFNNYPALDKPDDMTIDIIEETREEKTYRNWMNSMGVKPNVNRLYSDLQDGLILFQLYDIIKSGVVDWDKVKKQFKKMSEKFEKIGNCNYAVDLGKQMKFSLPGIGGTDIHDGNQTLTLGLVWQLMRAYTLAILKKTSEDGKPVEEKFIVAWANQRLKDCSISSFKDPSLKDGTAILKLIDCIEPNKIKWNIVKVSGSEEDNMSNAKYAISMGRKIGARIYALPEDIVEGKPKMVMTIFACLLTVDWEKAKKQQAE